MKKAIALFAGGTYGAGALIGLGVYSPAAIPLAVMLLNEAGAWQQALSSEATAPALGPPNPNGKKGSPAHQQKVAEIEADIRSRGLEPRTEYRFETVNGQKPVRYIDVVALDPATGRVVETHQVGRTLKNGVTPVSRERNAYRDVRRSPGLRGARR